MLYRITATIVCLLLSASIALPVHAQSVDQDQEQELRVRIQTQIDVEPIPPPEMGLIRSGTLFIIGGTALSSAGIWASLYGLEFRTDAIDLYRKYMELGYSADPDVYNRAWNRYHDAETAGIRYRVGGAIGVTTGILVMARGFVAVRQAAAASRKLAEKQGVDISGAQVLFSPMGVSVLWTF